MSDFKNTIESISFTFVMWDKTVCMVYIEKMPRGLFRCFLGTDGFLLPLNPDHRPDRFETIDEAICAIEYEYGEDIIGPMHSLKTQDFCIARFEDDTFCVSRRISNLKENFKTFDQAYEYVLSLYEEQEGKVLE